MNNVENNSAQKKTQAKFGFRFFTLFQHSGDSLFLFPLFILLFLLVPEPTKELSGTVLFGMTFTGILVFVLKRIFRKERPEGTAGKMYRKYDPFSFPSGHAARAWTIAVIAVFFHWPLSLWLSFWALLVSYSRLKLKLHDFTDVAAGLLLGILTGIFTGWLSLQLGF